MKYVLVVLVGLSIQGCGLMERGMASFTGGGAETCHAGVSYIQLTSGATVKYNTDGSIATCK